MMKREIDVWEYAGHIMKAVRKGVTITAAASGKINPMSISWGMLGIEWGKPLFITFVREGRFTRSMLDETMNFTVNFPLDAADLEIIRFCGRKSGRDTDKVAALGLTVVPSDRIDAPGIRELPLTLECKVIYKQRQDRNAMPPDVVDRNYPAHVGSDDPGANRDVHTAYYGEIVKAYIIE